jgi:hypothetical protein
MMYVQTFRFGSPIFPPGFLVIDVLHSLANSSGPFKCFVGEWDGNGRGGVPQVLVLEFVQCGEVEIFSQIVVAFGVERAQNISQNADAKLLRKNATRPIMKSAD